MSTETQEDRLARRIADLYDTDPQFAAAAPRPDRQRRRRQSRPAAARRSCRPSWRATPTGPRSAQRAVDYVDRPGDRPHHGRTAPPLRHHHLRRAVGPRAGRRRRAARRSRSTPATASPSSGFTSVDYTIIDIALTQLRRGVACRCRPARRHASCSRSSPRPSPRVIASSIDYLDDAVELDPRRRHAPAAAGGVRLPAEVDDQREALDAAKASAWPAPP